MNIILIGFMGTGKSCIGKLLAKNKNTKFIDMDMEIEKEKSMNISEIFDKYGEEYFRNFETKVLKKVMKDENDSIIATGGGIILKEENVNILKKGIVVLLTASSETIYNRTKRSTNRPLLLCADPYEKIKTLLDKRKLFYQKACNFEIDTTDLSPQEIVEKIEDKLLILDIK